MNKLDDEEYWQNVENLVRSHLRAYKGNRQDEGYTVHAMMSAIKGFYAVGLLDGDPYGTQT